MDYITLKVADVLAVTAADPTRHRADGAAHLSTQSTPPGCPFPSLSVRHGPGPASTPGTASFYGPCTRSSPCLSGLVALVSTPASTLAKCPVCPEAQKATRRRSLRIL